MLRGALVVSIPERRQRLTRDQMKAVTRARWRDWQRMLDEGVFESRAALARGEGVSRAAVTRGLSRLVAG